MRARLLSLNVDKSMSFTRFQARLVSSLNLYIDDDLGTEQFEDIRAMFMALQNALENDELIITVVDSRNYIRYKNALIQAFGNEAEQNSAVLNKIETVDELDDKRKKAFSTFPAAATVFVSDDGFYSGFGLENGSQCVLCLPIDNNRIDKILRDGVIPFLNNTFGSQVKDDNKTETRKINTEKVEIAVERILKSKSVVAINGTKNAEVLKSCGDTVKGFNNAFIFTPHVEDKGNVNVTEYTAQLAKVSLDLSSANIGACISDIYNTGEVKYICIAVASEQSAVVRKLYMSDNETDYEFVESAALELVELIGEKAIGLRSVGIEITDEPAVENVITEKDKKPAGKKPLVVLAIILGIVVVLSAVLGVIYKTQGENGELGNFLSSIFDKQEEQTTNPENTTEKPTIDAPVVETKGKLKFSDFIVNEYLNSPYSTLVSKDNPPEFITVNGKQMDAKEAIARIITAEIDINNYSVEAVKAQAVAIYSSLKYRNNGFVIAGVEISEVYPDEVKLAVDSVFGEYIAYKNKVALAPYHKVSANQTMDVSDYLPHLKSVKVDGYPDMSAKDYKTVLEYSGGDVKGALLQYDSSLKLSDNPSRWIVVNDHDGAVSSEAGYAISVNVGDVELDGLSFRAKFVGEALLPSHCFQIEYNSVKDVFVVTTYGQGYGIGMSLAGAKYMADNGAGYKDILTKYYSDITIVKEG
ncbi:MAG: hypothetical protein IKV25_05390 [Clostridia bacterium]|nr:hypothetical protein [Clostridia bacterium]